MTETAATPEEIECLRRMVRAWWIGGHGWALKQAIDDGLAEWNGAKMVLTPLGERMLGVETGA